MRAALVATLLLLPHGAQAQAACQLVGVWELVSGRTDSTPYPATLHARKLITKNHFVFISRDDGAIQEPRSTADTVAFLQSMAAGSGTYTVQGTTYTEKIEYFPDPAYIGRALPFSCRTEGDRFYQTGTVPVLEHGIRVRDVTVDEVWRRIE